MNILRVFYNKFYFINLYMCKHRYIIKSIDDCVFLICVYCNDINCDI